MKKFILTTCILLMICSTGWAQEIVYFETREIIYDMNTTPPAVVLSIPEDVEFGRYLKTAEGLENVDGNCKFFYKEYGKVLAKCIMPKIEINRLDKVNGGILKKLINSVDYSEIKDVVLKPYKKSEPEIVQTIKYPFVLFVNFLDRVVRKAYAVQTSVSDNFNIYDNLVDDWTIVSGIVEESDANDNVQSGAEGISFAYWHTNEMSSNDHTVQATTVTMTNYTGAGLVARYDPDTQDGYAGGYTDRTDDGKTYRIDNNSFVEIATMDRNPATGVVIKITVDGSTIKLFYDATEDDSTVDETYPTGKRIGLYVCKEDSYVPSLDDWSGGDIRDVSVGFGAFMIKNIF